MTGVTCTVLLDVDNTLLDNDLAKIALKARLRAVLGEAGDDQFWTAYTAVRAERGGVDIPRTIARFLAEQPGLITESALAAVFTTLPYADFLFADALATLAALRAAGHQPVILSDGDPIFQPHKIYRAGLTTAVAGAVAVVPDKTRELAAILAYYPARQLVVVDDKPAILAAARSQLPGVITVHIAQGHYGKDVPATELAAVDLRLVDIGELPAALAAVLARRTTVPAGGAR